MSNVRPLKVGATYDDLCAVPENLVAEMFDAGGWWILDAPELHFGVELLALASGRWSVVATHEGRAPVRAEPFDAIELELGALWA